VQKYADYYQVIKEPIDLRMIAQKIQANGYSSLDDMFKDLLLLTQNAKTFNKPSSLIYKVCNVYAMVTLKIKTFPAEVLIEYYVEEIWAYLKLSGLNSSRRWRRGSVETRANIQVVSYR
jgi:Bromodomain